MTLEKPEHHDDRPCQSPGLLNSRYGWTETPTKRATYPTILETSLRSRPEVYNKSASGTRIDCACTRLIIGFGRGTWRSDLSMFSNFSRTGSILTLLQAQPRTYRCITYSYSTARIMASASRVHLTAEQKPQYYVKSLTAESADRTSQLLQLNHEKHHVFFNQSGFHVSTRVDALSS